MMAVRPVFVPAADRNELVREHMVEFKWQPGMSLTQARKNIEELHRSAAHIGLEPLLEISSKGSFPLGRRLSAFNLKLDVAGEKRSIESIFQSSKVFENGGPYLDLLEAEPRDAKRDARLRTSGRIVKFKFLNTEFPSEPTTIFYDYLYVLALKDHAVFLDECLSGCAGFTDIVFNPEKSSNCQARSCALFISLYRKNILEQSVSSFNAFEKVLLNHKSYFINHSAVTKDIVLKANSWEEFLTKKRTVRKAATSEFKSRKRSASGPVSFDSGLDPKTR